MGETGQAAFGVTYALSQRRREGPSLRGEPRQSAVGTTAMLLTGSRRCAGGVVWSVLLWRSATSRSRVRIEGWQAKPASRKRDPLRTRQWASMLTDHKEGAANDMKKASRPPDARERGAGAQEGKGVMVGRDRRGRERWIKWGHRRVLG